MAFARHCRQARAWFETTIRRVDVDAQLDVRDILQASREERGENEQHHRERDLRRKESAAGASRARGAHKCSATKKADRVKPVA
jgi:hypothetical protein